MPRVRLVVQRRVARPAGREAAEEDRRRQDPAGRHQQPEGERLDPREGHPPRADHHRHEVVGERAEDRARHHPHHHRAVQPDEGQVLGRHGRPAVRAQELEADQHRVQAADEEEQPDARTGTGSRRPCGRCRARSSGRRPASPSRAATAGSRASCSAGRRAKPSPTRKPIVAEEVAEEHARCRSGRVAEVLEARGVDLVAEEPAEVAAADRRGRSPVSEVETDQAPPERRRPRGCVTGLLSVIRPGCGSGR